MVASGYDTGFEMDLIVKNAHEMLIAAQKDGLVIEVSFEDGGHPLYKGTVAEDAWRVFDAYDPRDGITFILYDGDQEVGRAAYSPYHFGGPDLHDLSGPWLKRWFSEE